MNNELLVIDNFLSDEECLAFLEEAKQADVSKWIIQKDFNQNKFLKLRNHKLLINIKNRLLLLFEKTFQPDLVQSINKNKPGTTWAPSSEIEQGQTGKYKVTIYLNNDLDSMKIFYSKLNSTIFPKPGTLIVHPANDEYSYNIQENKNEEYYTLSLFVRDMAITKE